MAFVTGNRVTLIERGVRWYAYNSNGEGLPLRSEVILPVYGEVYTIRGVGQTILGPTLVFHEIRNTNQDGIEVGFLAKNFRRVTDITIFDKFLVPLEDQDKELLMQELVQKMDEDLKRYLDEHTVNTMPAKDLNKFYRNGGVW